MTAIDFTAEVEKRKEDLLADLFSLLEINSERDDSRHYVHVGKNSENFFSITKLKMSCVVIDISRWVAIAVCDFKEFLQGFYWPRSKWMLSVGLAVVTF